MTSKKGKGRNSGKSATQKTSKPDDKDMSAAAQRQRVVSYLRAGSQTTYSLRKRGISHPAMRVKELIARGYVIDSSPVTAIDSDGYAHNRVALYTLIAEPEIAHVKPKDRMQRAAHTEACNV